MLSPAGVRSDVRALFPRIFAPLLHPVFYHAVSTPFEAKQPFVDRLPAIVTRAYAARFATVAVAVSRETPTMWTRVPTRNAVQTGPHAVETISLLGGTHENVNVGPSRRSRVTGTDDVAPLTSVSHTSRSRLIGFTAGVVFALFAIAGVAATHDGVRDVAFTKMAALGRGRSPAVSSRAESHEDWLLGDFSEQPRGEPKLGAFPRKAGGKGSGSTLSGAREGFAQRDGSSRDGSSVASRSNSSPNSSRGLRNAEGGVPGLVRHVDGVTTTTRFRMISFCNQAYWPFAHGMLQSMQVNAPTLVPFWTIMVADEDTKKFIHKNAPNIDVFVDVDLQTLVSDAEDADLGELKKLLCWRRMHALYGLVNADYTTVFLEPDVVFTKNPLQLFHDMLLDADIVASSDFGFGHAAVSRVNTKVLFAKPSDEAKKLLDVWQRAEVRAGAFPILTLFAAPL